MTDKLHKKIDLNDLQSRLGKKVKEKKVSKIDTKRMVYDGFSDPEVKKKGIIYDGRFPGGIAPNGENGYIPLDKANISEKVPEITNEDKEVKFKERFDSEFKKIVDRHRKKEENEVKKKWAKYQYQHQNQKGDFDNSDLNNMPQTSNNEVGSISDNGDLSLEKIKKLSPEELAAYEGKLLLEDSGLGKEQEEIEKKLEKYEQKNPEKDIAKISEKNSLSGEFEKLESKNRFQKAFGYLGDSLKWAKRNTIDKVPYYKEYSEYMNTGNKWQKFGKRIVFSGTLGVIGGTAGAVLGGGALLLGAGIGGALALKRVAIRFTVGSGAGLLHKQLTKNKLEKKIKEKSLDKYFDELDKKDIDLNKSLDFDARDRDLLKRLRSEKLAGNLSEEDELKLSFIEKIRKDRAEEIKKQIDGIRKQRDEIKRRLIAKNERNNLIVSAATGFVTTLSIRYGALLLHELGVGDVGLHNNIPEGHKVSELDKHTGNDKNLETGGTQTEGTQTEGTQTEGTQTEGTQTEGTQTEGTQTEELSHVDNVPDNAYIHKGDGITYILKRQFENNPDLAEKFGIKNGTGEEYKELAKKLGYLNENYEVRLKLNTDKGYFVTLDKDGNPVVLEVDKDGNVIEQNSFGRDFEGEDIEGKYESLYKKSGEILNGNNSTNNVTINTGTSGDSADIDLSSSESVYGTTTGDEVYDNYADVDTNNIDTTTSIDNEELVSGSAGNNFTPEEKNIFINHLRNGKTKILFNVDENLTIKRLGGNYLKIKVPSGMTAVIKQNRIDNSIQSIVYHSYKNGYHDKFLDSNGDGIIDKYIHKKESSFNPHYGRKSYDFNERLKDDFDYAVNFNVDGNPDRMLIRTMDGTEDVLSNVKINNMRKMILTANKLK